MLGIKTWHVSTRMFLKDARNMDSLGSASLMMIAWQAACHAVKCHVTTAGFFVQLGGSDEVTVHGGRV
jgi:hypothetical protein